ncbi:MAG TPA: endonuclease [Gammaproteobacteria bacterium]|nr:endonuclease [Gammaproteobacteria bacterium]
MTPAPELLLERLTRAYGRQHWWPARTRFEVLVGAVLVQNTAWSNVERAIAVLRRRDLLAPGVLDACPEADLAAAIRPAGTFRVKARRLKALCRWFLEHGGFAGLERMAPEPLRRSLLEVHGVGRETADAILVYALGQPRFVVDAYARRLFARLGLISASRGYEEIRRGVEARPWRQPLHDLGELHALIVEHGKRTCRPRPHCRQCCLRDLCPWGAGDTAFSAATVRRPGRKTPGR